MTDDELRNILGADVYDELEQFSQSEIPLLQKLISPSSVEDIAQNVYVFPFSFEGETALDLMGNLIHAAEQGCVNCENKVMRFAGSMIGAMWVTMLEEQEMIRQEGRPDDDTV